jgi:hypothetical protein
MRAARSQARAQALRENWIENTVLAANQHQQSLRNEQDRVHFMRQRQMQHDMERHHYQNGLDYSGGDRFGPQRPYDSHDPYNPRYSFPNNGIVATADPYSREYGIVYEQELHPMRGQQQSYGEVVHLPLDQVFDRAPHEARQPPQLSRAPGQQRFELDPSIRQSEMQPYVTPALQEMRWDGQPHALPLMDGRFPVLQQVLSPGTGQTHIPSRGQDDVTPHEPTDNFTENYPRVMRPSDIIVSNWERQDLVPTLDAIHAAGPADMPTEDLLPFLETEEELPLQEIDFGDMGELFGGLLGGKQPGVVEQGTEGMVDYQQALRQQEEMDFGLQRL